MKSDRFCDYESRQAFEDELSTFFKNQTQPDEESSDDADGDLLKKQRKQDLKSAIDKFNLLD